MDLGCAEETSSFMSGFIRECGGYVVIDGGFATELERHGADLNDPLWSAKCLIDSPDLVRRVHLDYLDAGANIILTASYQATIQGFEAKGFSRDDAEALLRKSVEIACEAREIYYDQCAKESWDIMENVKNSRRPILVVASVGSYGAYLADGSEYSGIYGDTITLETLKDFHRRRVQILANSGADLIAFETIPNKLEAKEVLMQVPSRQHPLISYLALIKSFSGYYVDLKGEYDMYGDIYLVVLLSENQETLKAYAALLQEEGIEIPAWFSFNSKDGINVVSGDPIAECASIADSCKKVVAVGVNCTPPRFIHGLVASIRKITSKPVLIYPNSGEMYDAQNKQWVESSGDVDEDFVAYIVKWQEAGASLFGGCCRTTPKTIRAISKALSDKN